MKGTVHDLKCKGSNPGQVELGVHSTAFYVMRELNLSVFLPSIISVNINSFRKWTGFDLGFIYWNVPFY